MKIFQTILLLACVLICDAAADLFPAKMRSFIEQFEGKPPLFMWTL